MTVRGVDEAKAAIAALRDDREFQKAWLDKQHAGHAAAVARRAELYAAAYPEPGAAPAASPVPAVKALPAPKPATPEPKPVAQRIAEARKDPAYWDKQHPGHSAAVDRVGALYREAAPAPAASPAAPAPAPQAA